MFNRRLLPADFHTVRLRDALTWLGLKAFPPAGEEFILPVGTLRDPPSVFSDVATEIGTPRSYMLHVGVNYMNNVHLYVERKGDPKKRPFSFEGTVVYNGDGPLLLRLNSLQIPYQERVRIPEAEDTKLVFEAFRIGMQRGLAPGSYGNNPSIQIMRRGGSPHRVYFPKSTNG